MELVNREVVVTITGEELYGFIKEKTGVDLTGYANVSDDATNDEGLLLTFKK